MRALLRRVAAQLAKIDVGGLFRGLCNRLPAIEPVTNRRQTNPWERTAVHQLRHGDTRQAIAGYADRGRLTNPRRGGGVGGQATSGG